MIRFLVGLNLAIVALWLAAGLVAYATNLNDAAHFWRMAQVEEFERVKCDMKHATLIKQITKEGLAKRLGLGGQPWLK